MPGIKNRDFGDIQTYMQQLYKVPAISAEEREVLIAKAQSGDKEAEKKLIACEVRLVISVAKSYVGRGLLLSDLIAEGTFGLYDALRKYNPTQGTWATYATHWIKQHIRRAIANQSKLVRIPLYIYHIISHWKKTAQSLRDCNPGYEPTAVEIGEKLGLNAKQIRLVLAALTEVKHLPMGEDRGIRSGRQDIDVPDTKTPHILDTMVSNEAVANLPTRMKRLKPKEAAIIQSRFLDDEPKTLEEAGALVGVSRQRAEQLEKSALAKLC